MKYNNIDLLIKSLFTYAFLELYSKNVFINEWKRNDYY